MASFLGRQDDQEPIIDLGLNSDLETAAASKEMPPGSSETPELYEKDGESRFGTSTSTSGPSFRSRLPQMPVAFSMISMPSFISKDGSTGSRFILVGLGALVVMFIIILGLSVGIGQLNQPKENPVLCTDRDCLWEASYVQSNMNLSVDPCQDFFHYACGNFPQVNPLSNAGGDVDVQLVIDNANDEKLQDALEAPVKDYRDVSAEKKIKVFFQSCLDDYLRTAMGGGPLIQMIENFGGWQSMPGTGFDPSQWDDNKLNDFLKKTHADYGVDPFFKIYVGDDLDMTRSPPKETYMVELGPASVSMYSLNDYLRNTSSSRYHQAGYKDLMTTYLQLLWEDFGHAPDNQESVIDQLFEDVMLVETAIASYSNGFIILDPTHSHVPLSSLATKYKGKINWFELISYYFRGAGITQNTPVHLYYIDYMTKMTNFISTLNATTINNYVMWKVAYLYVHELGWEYLHANRIWAWIKYDGYVNYVGHYRWCIIELQRNLQYLLSSLFVQDNFVGLSLPQVQTMYNYMKKAMENRINAWNWMDAPTKKEAFLKIDGIIDKIGHPAWMQDNDYINTYYKQMQIVQDQHFLNMQHIYQFKRIEATQDIITHTVDRSKWPIAVYQPYPWYDNWWNELFMPAGMLQHPIFDWRIPQYMNFAAAGRYIGELMISAVDNSGNWMDHLGMYNNWWSTQTTANFKNVQNCHAMLYANATYCYDATHCDLNQYRNLNQMAKPNWRNIGALSLALDAFKLFNNDYGSSGALVGLQSDSIDQVFFLGFAQTFCYDRSDYNTFWYWYWYAWPPEPLFVNKVLSQMPAFANAYQCSSGSPLVGKSCQGF